MRLHEIAIVGGQTFTEEQQICKNDYTSGDAVLQGNINGYDLYCTNFDNEVRLFFMDNENLAAMVFFNKIDDNSRWQVFKAEALPKYSKKKLVPQIYKQVVAGWGIEVVSDKEQTVGGQALWKKSLVSMQMNIKMLDTETGEIFEKSDIEKANNMYPYIDSGDPVEDDKGERRWVWILVP